MIDVNVLLHPSLTNTQVKTRYIKWTRMKLTKLPSNPYRGDMDIVLPLTTLSSRFIYLICFYDKVALDIK